MTCPIRRARVLALVLVSAILVVASPATAETETGPNRLGLPGLSSTVVTPAESGPSLRLGLLGDTGTYDPEHGIAVDLDEPEVSSRTLRFLLQLRAGDRLVLGGSLPYRFVGVEGGESSSGIGDARASAVARLFDTGPVRFGAWSSVRLPTGDEASGLSTGQIEGEAGLIATGRFFREGLAPELRWHLNVGLRQNKNESQGYGDYYTSEGFVPPSEAGIFFPSYPAVGDRDAGDNDMLLLRTAVEFRQRWGHLYLEYSSDWLAWYDDIGYGESASWITPGLFLGTEDGPSLSAAWSIGLFVDDPDTDYDPKLPDWRFELGLSAPIFIGGRDRDDDLVPDSEDACPDEPEDVDGYRDEDGCPDPDNDGDGIPDVDDLAPNLPEDLDGFEDDDGRPDLDNDLDGIPDSRDRCPMVPEDFDGDRDDDGCPDIVTDADGDGIRNSQDACPEAPEDFDGFEDEDGCPDLDNDLDGIDDYDDQCPDEPEDYDGDRDDDGCPDDPGASSSSERS